MPEHRLDPAHAWFRARLDAHALALLDDDEEREFLAHARSCGECGEAMKRHRNNAILDRPDMHIPSRLLARWDRAQRLLRGMPRRLVREHLERCPSCRQDLQVLGFPVVLEKDTALEGDSEPPGPLTIAEDAPRVRVIVSEEHGPAPWTGWITGAVVGAGIAAGVMLLIPVPRGQDTALPPVGTTSPPLTVASQPAPTFDLGVLPPPITLRRALRGAGNGVIEVSVAVGTHALQFRVPELFLADSTLLSIRLERADGSTVVAIDRPYSDISGGRTLLLQSPRGFEAGSYVLAVQPQVSGGAEPQHRFVFHLARAP